MSKNVKTIEIANSLDTILRLFANQTGPVTYATIEKQAGVGAKTGLYATTAGLINGGVLVHTGGPEPVRKHDIVGADAASEGASKKRTVPRIEFDRDATLLEMPAAARALANRLLG